jgi:predicted nucleic acid-binding protein
MAVSRLLLIDKSAYVRGGAEAELDGEFCLCPVSRLELLFSARSPADYVALETDLAQFRELRMDGETFATANTAQRELANSGRHRVPVPDLLIAACAQQHAADIVHVDRHFDVLSSVLHFNSIHL